VKIFLDNVNINSNSGPNSFGRKLKKEFEILGHETVIDVIGKREKKPDIQLSFIAAQFKVAPLVQRLDGIYFNSEQDFNSLNAPIEATYQSSDAVIFQSEFNKNLTSHYFGKKERSFVIRNGTDLEAIYNVQPLENVNLDEFNNVWCCASSWRPHKRLSENIRYFLECAPSDDCLVIAGENTDKMISNPRIFYAGDLEWNMLISLYKRSKYFIHLALSFISPQLWIFLIKRQVIILTILISIAYL
jgi:glycosyltransferase involved in cell wall biosynthesis